MRYLKKRASVALIVTILASLFTLSPTHTRPASAWTIAEDTCRINWTKSRWHLKQLIKCAEERWAVPGGPDKAIAVARCESGLRPRATGNGNAGIYQHRVIYWPDRADTFGFDGWSVYNARANIMVAIRMVHRGGWTPWSCA